MIYRAHYSFRSDTTTPLTEEQSSIQYEADSQEKAVQAFVRWWNNRHSAVPEYFREIFAVKIYQITIQRIKADGYLPSSTSIVLFEWKYDWPNAEKLLNFQAHSQK